MDNANQPEGAELQELERKLRDGLQRVPAPLGFEARVMSAAREQTRRKHWLRLRAGWALAMVLLLGGIGGAVEYQRVEYANKAAEANEQAGLALHIAAEKLDLVRHELNNKGDQR